MSERDDRLDGPDGPDGPGSGPADPTGGDATLDEVAVATAFRADVGGEVVGLLASDDLWAEPSDGIADRIAAEIATESAGATETADTAEIAGATGASDAAGVVSSGVAAAGSARSPDGRFAVAADRVWSWRPIVLGGAAVLVLLFAGVTLLSAFGDDAAEEVFDLELVPTGRLVDVEGDVTVTTTDSGIRVELDAPSLPVRDGDQFYEGWLRTDDDLLVPIGTFRTGDGVVLSAGVDLDRVVALSVTLEQAAAADSAEQASSGDVVLKVDFPRR